jgi:outer membrane protein, multidrug efflux system
MKRLLLKVGLDRISERMRRAGALLLTTLLSACALEPVYERPGAPVSSNYPTGLAYGSTKPSGSAAPAAADIGWRDFLTDPRLQRLVEIALANNRDLRVTALQVQEAQAQYRIERAALLPSVSASAQASSSRTPASLSSTGAAYVLRDYSVGPSVSWELDFFGRLRSLKEQALYQYLGTEQALKAEQILIVSEVADQYLTLLAADEELAVTRQTLESSQKSYELTRLQFQTGTGSELSLREAETVVEQAKANLASQLRARAQAENALVLLLGQPLPADLPSGNGLGGQSMLADIPAGLPSDLLTRRPDVLEAEAALRAANANIGAARAAFFPTISLTGSYGTASASLSGLFRSGSQAWSFAPSITMPIFEGGRLRAELDVAKLEKDVSVAQYEKAVQNAFREVADGLAARGTYDDQVAALERYTNAQQRRFDLSELRFKQGVDDYLTVLTAQTDLYSAQLSLVSARLNRLTNRVDLYRELGGGWVEKTAQN